MWQVEPPSCQDDDGEDNNCDTDQTDIGVITPVEVAAVSSLPKARKLVQGQNTLFLINSGTEVYLINTHGVDVSQLRMIIIGRGFKMCNESGQADIYVHSTVAEADNHEHWELWSCCRQAESAAL